MPTDNRDALYAVLQTYPLYDKDHEPTDGSLVVVVERFNSQAERDAFVQGVVAACNALPEDLYLDTDQAVRQPHAWHAENLRGVVSMGHPLPAWVTALEQLDAAQAARAEEDSDAR